MVVVVVWVHQMWLDIKNENNRQPPAEYLPLQQTWIDAIANFQKEKEKNEKNNKKKTTKSVEVYDDVAYDVEIKYKFWNMADVCQLFVDHPRRLKKKYKEFFHNGLQTHIERCDMARYCVMGIYEGFYIDLDSKCQGGSLDFLVEPFRKQQTSHITLLFDKYNHLAKNLVEFVGTENNNAVANGVLWSYGCDKFWIHVLDRLIVDYDGDHKFVFENTGPILLTRMKNQWQSQFTFLFGSEFRDNGLNPSPTSVSVLGPPGNVVLVDDHSSHWCRSFYQAYKVVHWLARSFVEVMILITVIALVVLFFVGYMVIKFRNSSLTKSESLTTSSVPSSSSPSSSYHFG